MRVYLIRHGKAQRQSLTGLDADRCLAARGREQAAWLGAELREGDFPPERVLCSPAARALETAELLGEGLGVEVEVDERLGLGTTASTVVELIGSLEGAGSVALVGHNPTLSVVADVLCDGVAGGRGIGLRTGEAAVIEVLEMGDVVGKAELVGLLRAETL